MKVLMVLYPGEGNRVEFGPLEGQPVLGSDEGALGLKGWIEEQGHEVLVTCEREGEERSLRTSSGTRRS